MNVMLTQAPKDILALMQILMQINRLNIGIFVIIENHCLADADMLHNFQL